MIPKETSIIRNISTLTIIFGIVLLCFIWVGLYYKVQNERQMESDNAFKETANYARTFEEHTIRTFKGLDLIALSLKQQLEKEGLGIDLFRLLKEERFAGQPFILLGVLNANGDLIANTIEPFVGGINNSDREFFYVHKAADTGKLFIGKPYYKEINLGEGSTIALVGRDNIVRVRQAGSEVVFGQDFSNSVVMSKVPFNDAGNFIASSPVDGISRIYSYRALREYPLVVVAGVSEAQVFQGLNHRIAGYLWACGLMSTVIVLFVKR